MHFVSHFLASEFPNAPAGRARFHVIPAPMEVSVSYGAGAGRGPAAILAASDQLEALDEGRVPGAWGVHTQAAVDGPPPRPPEAPAAERTRAAERWLRAIGRRVAAALDAGAVPVLLGGEHTVTVAAARVYRRRRLRVGFVQFDAHADLRARYQGTPLSHACAMRRVHDLGFPLFQLATRAYAAEEAAYRRRSAIAFRDAGSLVGPDAAAAMTLPPDFPEAIHITFDVDAFDPAVIPATGTPVPGGLDWYGACRLLAAVTAGRRIVGCDVVELAPNPALPYADFAAALLAYRLMGLAGPGRQRRGERP